ncbi:CPXCG motif-containing cysteine-rich protein [Halomonas caseinilytica]|uniref:Cysteine-rich CPXCG n=1 Tax=Halomonas caseinilytica TaxID=438744 RepID=A0A1M6QSF8_9GAMM|nr:CPXCG motif-containing cysteine-rich protein [Halomonas caseinilytica]SEM00469.1 Cysteine-rich CPXCG [Halomonas caseinilytica]SHK23191.1 Cysteine-rich CPXCG [Halomonas caseinilytica]
MHEDALESRSVRCPYCDTPFALLVDASQGSHATWEDCPRCCAPIQVRIEVSSISGDIVSVTLGRDDDVL